MGRDTLAPRKTTQPGRTTAITGGRPTLRSKSTGKARPGGPATRTPSADARRRLAPSGRGATTRAELDGNSTSAAASRGEPMAAASARGGGLMAASAVSLRGEPTAAADGARSDSPRRPSRLGPRVGSGSRAAATRVGLSSERGAAADRRRGLKAECGIKLGYAAICGIKGSREPVGTGGRGPDRRSTGPCGRTGRPAGRHTAAPTAPRGVRCATAPRKAKERRSAAGRARRHPRPDRPRASQRRRGQGPSPVPERPPRPLAASPGARQTHLWRPRSPALTGRRRNESAPRRPAARSPVTPVTSRQARSRSAKRAGLRPPLV